MVQKQTTAPPASKLSWDDLRVALALGRSGSLRGAARQLRVSHSTVLRRLGELEAATGVRLFERKAEKYELTLAGHDVFDTARELEDAIVSLERRVEGRDLKLAGPIHVTMPDPLLPALLPILRRFGEQYPDIALTVGSGIDFVNLGQREADVALRITGEPPPDLVGRRVANVACGIYGSKRYLEGRATRQLERLSWVGWPEGSRWIFSEWMRKNVPQARVALRLQASWAVQDALNADVGVALLPCAIGDLQSGWQRLKLVPEVAAPLWILTHRDLRATARVRVLREVLWLELSAARALLEGHGRLA